MASSVLVSFTRAERQLVHCIGFVSAVRHDDDRLPLVMGKMSEIVRGLKERVQTAKVLAAAHALLSSYSNRNKADGGAAWARARLDADDICVKFHWLSIADLDGGAHG